MRTSVHTSHEREGVRVSSKAVVLSVPRSLAALLPNRVGFWRAI